MVRRVYIADVDMIATYKRSGPASRVGGAVLTVISASLPDTAAQPHPSLAECWRESPRTHLIVDTGQHMVVLGARCSVACATCWACSVRYGIRTRAGCSAQSGVRCGSRRCISRTDLVPVSRIGVKMEPCWPP